MLDIVNALSGGSRCVGSSAEKALSYHLPNKTQKQNPSQKSIMTWVLALAQGRDPFPFGNSHNRRLGLQAGARVGALQMWFPISGGQVKALSLMWSQGPSARLARHELGVRLRLGARLTFHDPKVKSAVRLPCAVPSIGRCHFYVRRSPV